VERLAVERRVGGAVQGGPERGVAGFDERELAGVKEAQRGDGLAEARRGPCGVGLGGGGVEEREADGGEGEDDRLEDGGVGGGGGVD
jgi:hypothetical protein